MTKEAQITNEEKARIGHACIRHRCFVIDSSFVIRHSSF